MASFTSSVLSEGAVREGKPIIPRSSLAGSQARQYQGLFIHQKPEASQKTHPKTAMVAGLGYNGGSAAAALSTGGFHAGPWLLPALVGDFLPQRRKAVRALV